MRVNEAVARKLIKWAEEDKLPDPLVRLGMSRVVASRLRKETAGSPQESRRFWREVWEGPVAVHTDTANVQHYEVPAAFFALVLGPHLKYSSCWWPPGVDDLATAEEAMLSLTAERALLADGQEVLDLGCGWGSLTLWAARRFPASRFVAVSNSATQRAHIEAAAAAEHLGNVEVLTADIATFDAGRRFDRIVSVEMLEHVRNHRELFNRMHRWVTADGAVFVHVFAHREFAYPFEASGPGSWMAQHFFTGGMMPSPALLLDASDSLFDLDGEWWIDGIHYAKTLDAWLAALDGRRDDVHDVLAPVYGDDVELWIQRWRMFFMACAQMFSFRDGTEWGLAHLRLTPR
jgi:cyclopropane-fatty-acyl-phospholipid synthase